jgi:hypothetical protein
MQLQIADVPRCACNYTQALGLKNFESPDVAVGSLSPNWESLIYHGTNELLQQRQSVPAQVLSGGIDMLHESWNRSLCFI